MALFLRRALVVVELLTPQEGQTEEGFVGREEQT
jgi:hypothetical protein